MRRDKIGQVVGEFDALLFLVTFYQTIVSHYVCY